MISPVPVLNEEYDKINQTEESIMNLEESISILMEQEKQKADLISSMSFKINNNNKSKTRQLSEKDKVNKSIDDNLNLAISVETRKLEDLERNLSNSKRKYEIINEEMQNIQNLNENLNIHMKTTQSHYHSLLDQQDTDIQPIADQQTLEIPEQINVLNKKIQAVNQSIKSIDEIHDLIQNKLSLLKQTENVLLNEINSKKVSLQKIMYESQEKDKMQPKVQKKSIYQMEKQIHSQEIKNRALQEEINNIDGQLTYATDLLNKNEEKIEIIEKQIEDSRSELATIKFKTELIRKRAPPITNKLLESISDSKITLFQKIDRLNHEREDQDNKIQNMTEECLTIQQQIEDQISDSKKLDKIEQKLYKMKVDANDNTKEIQLEKQLKVLEHDIQKQQNELTNEIKKLDKIMPISPNHMIRNNNYENNEAIQKIEKLSRINDALKSEIEYYTQLKRSYAKNINTMAKKLYYSYLQNPEQNSDVLAYTSLRSACSDLRSKIKEKARQVRSKMDYIDTRNDTLRKEIAKYGHYDPTRDVLVIIDSSKSDISKKLSFYESILMEFTKQIGIFEDNTSDYKYFLEKYSTFLENIQNYN